MSSIFFVERLGWDHHAEVLDNQADMLPDVSAALRAFYDATEGPGFEPSGWWKQTAASGN